MTPHPAWRTATPLRQQHTIDYGDATCIPLHHTTRRLHRVSSNAHADALQRMHSWRALVDYETHGNLPTRGPAMPPAIRRQRARQRVVVTRFDDTSDATCIGQAQVDQHRSKRAPEWRLTRYSHRVATTPQPRYCAYPRQAPRGTFAERAR
ncbi:hypothetical protein LLE67_15405 [Xanthomonas campestris]|nr:hypothetical protein [Xanthomonas campestris]